MYASSLYQRVGRCSNCNSIQPSTRTTAQHTCMYDTIAIGFEHIRCSSTIDSKMVCESCNELSLYAASIMLWNQALSTLNPTPKALNTKASLALTGLHTLFCERPRHRSRKAAQASVEPNHDLGSSLIIGKTREPTTSVGMHRRS